MNDHNHGGGYDPRFGVVRDLVVTITDDPSAAGEDSHDLTGFTAHGQSVDHPHSHNGGNLLHTHAHTHDPGDTSHIGHHNTGN